MNLQPRQFWSSLCGEYEEYEYCLTGFDAVQYDTKSPTFPKNLIPSSYGQKKKAAGSSETFVTTQNTVTFKLQPFGHSLLFAWAFESALLREFLYGTTEYENV